MLEPTPQANAFAEQYEVAFRRLRRTFIARGMVPEEASDLAQEAAARLLAHVERRGVDERCEDLTPLLNKIAANLFVDHIRAKSRRTVSLDAVDLEEWVADPVEEVIRRHQGSVVRQAIGELPERQRDALLMSLHGHAPGEIAERMGLQRNAADALLHRARKRLGVRLRALQGELHGIAVLALWRIRSVFKRSSGGEVVVAMSPAVAGILSAALTFGMGAAPAAAADAPQSVAAHVAPSAAAPASIDDSSAADAADGATDGSHERPRKRSVDIRDHRVSVSTTVTDPTGRQRPFGIEIWHERDGESETGALLDTLTDTLCGHAPCSDPEE